MAEESFILVSLKDDKAKKLAQVISNDSSRRILELLSKGSMTETQIAEALNQPISTIHYNISHLTQAKLVESNEYHYSEKGKVVNHYSLSNKFVIIAPKDTPESFREKLKKILPVTFIMVAIAAVIQFISWFRMSSSKGQSAFMAAAPNLAAEPEAARATAEHLPMVAKTALDAAAGVQESLPGAATLMTEALNQTVENATQNIPQAFAQPPEVFYQTIQTTAQSHIALWFILGALVALVLYLIVERIIEKKET